MTWLVWNTMKVIANIIFTAANSKADERVGPLPPPQDNTRQRSGCYTSCLVTNGSTIFWCSPRQNWVQRLPNPIFACRKKIGFMTVTTGQDWDIWNYSGTRRCPPKNRRDEALPSRKPTWRDETAISCHPVPWRFRRPVTSLGSNNTSLPRAPAPSFPRTTVNRPMSVSDEAQE